jgi:hypothetical protein
MKKLLIVLLALTVVGIFAFADDAAPAAAAPVVTIGDWGRQIFAVGNVLGNKNIQAGLGTSWGADPRIVGLQIGAHTENVGFAISPCADNGTFGLTDENKAWVSPLAGLTFESGITLETDTWRGATDWGSDDWIRYPGLAVSGNSTTFARLGEGGFMSDVNYNKDGIGVWYGIQNSTSSSSLTINSSAYKETTSGTKTTESGISYDSGDSVSITNLQAGTQIGAAYTIAGIGMIKAQFLGRNVSGNTFLGNPGGADIVNAAFNLSAVKGLYEEAAVVIPTTDVGYTFAFADDFSYAFAPATFHARVEGVSYDSKDAMASAKLGIAGNFGMDYDVGNGVGAGFSVDLANSMYEHSGAADKSQALAGVLVDIKKSFANGYVGIGFQYSTMGFAGTDFTTTGDQGYWAIPIVCQESF